MIPAWTMAAGITSIEEKWPEMNTTDSPVSAICCKRSAFTTATRVGSLMILSRIGNSRATRPASAQLSSVRRAISASSAWGKAILRLVWTTLWVLVSGPSRRNSQAPKSDTASMGNSRARPVTRS